MHGATCSTWSARAHADWSAHDAPLKKWDMHIDRTLRRGLGGCVDSRIPGHFSVPFSQPAAAVRVLYTQNMYVRRLDCKNVHVCPISEHVNAFRVCALQKGFLGFFLGIHTLHSVAGSVCICHYTGEVEI